MDPAQKLALKQAQLNELIESHPEPRAEYIDKVILELRSALGQLNAGEQTVSICSAELEELRKEVRDGREAKQRWGFVQASLESDITDLKKQIHDLTSAAAMAGPVG